MMLMNTRKIFFTEKISPIKASDFAHILSNNSMESHRLHTILVEAVKSVAAIPDCKVHWDTDAEQHFFNVVRAIVGHSAKIVNNK